LKTIVINQKDDARVPFLRGILIRSLLDTGLSFEQAYEVADAIRSDLSDVAEIGSRELRDRVGERLARAGFEDELDLYATPPVAPARIVVAGMNGGLAAFSRGKHERYLQASGLRLEKAEQTTALIYEHMLAAGIERISTDQLGLLTYYCLQQEVSRKAADRYLVWSEYQRSGRPLLLLICGAVGTGKSTIATEAAHLLDVVRIQSTDMLREVMRMMLPPRLMPVLHASTFNAWKALPIQDKKERSREQLIADGYRSQMQLLTVACQAVLARAVEESVPLILEGVHAHPEVLEQGPEPSDAVVVQVMLAVLRAKDLKSRLRGRGVLVPQRRAKRYLNKFDSIWTLQSFLLSEADRCDVPIITNQDKDKAVMQVILHVNQELSRRFEGSLADVFGQETAAWAEAAREDSWRVLVDRLAK
jgi:2-phosphoglycerate kinase